VVKNLNDWQMVFAKTLKFQKVGHIQPGTDYKRPPFDKVWFSFTLGPLASSLRVESPTQFSW